MIKKIFFYTIFIFFMSVITNAQTDKLMQKYLKNRNEAYISIKINNNEDILILDKIVGIDTHGIRKNSKEISAYINTKQYKQLLKTNYKFEVKTPPSLLKAASMCSNNDDVINWNCYPTYEQYINLMNKFADDYPEICSLHEIGKSVDGRKILAIKISDNVNVDEEEPEFFYTSTMHGDETAGYILMNRLISYLLNNYETSNRIKQLIDTKEIWINPLANPDGTYAAENSTITGAKRNNSNSFDLNRNFPDPQYGEYPGGTRQIETQDMMDFMEAHNFLLVANFHGGAEVVNYPWDTWSNRHGDDEWYKQISQKYADVVHENSSGYMTSYNNGITNGYDWYPIHGGRQDYTNYNLHSREITIELSNDKIPDASILNNLWNYNYNSLLEYIENLDTYVYGKITDTKGNPIEASMHLNTDKDNSEIISNKNTGIYYRLLTQGSYNFTFKADGYKDKEAEPITINTGNNKELNIVLEIDNTTVDTITKNKFKIVSYQNPFKDELKFELDLLEDTEIKVLIYNILGKLVLETTNKLYNSGTNFININTQELEKGIFMCAFKTVKYNLRFKMIKI